MWREILAGFCGLVTFLLLFGICLLVDLLGLPGQVDLGGEPPKKEGCDE